MDSLSHSHGVQWKGSQDGATDNTWACVEEVPGEREDGDAHITAARTWPRWNMLPLLPNKCPQTLAGHLTLPAARGF